jgi:hypothetical protein
MSWRQLQTYTVSVSTSSPISFASEYLRPEESRPPDFKRQLEIDCKCKQEERRKSAMISPRPRFFPTL